MVDIAFIPDVNFDGGHGKMRTLHDFDLGNGDSVLFLH